MQVGIAAACADTPERCRNQPPEVAAAQQRAILPLQRAKSVELPASAARRHSLSWALAHRSSFARWAASRVHTAIASACSRRVPQRSALRSMLRSGAHRPEPELPRAAKPRASQRVGEPPSYYVHGTPHFRRHQLHPDSWSLPIATRRRSPYNPRCREYRPRHLSRQL